MFTHKFQIAVFACLASLSLAFANCYSAVPVPSAPPVLNAAVNVSGVWESKDWEQCWIHQDGADISGQLGDYQVQGQVVGNDIHMYLVYHGRVYHTLKLTLSAPNQMIGYYYYGLVQPGSSARRYAASFVRVSSAAPPK
jgi:hypothetical protein